MSATLLQVIGILAVIVLAGTMLMRPAGVVPVVLAVGVVLAAIVVTWNQVETFRAQKAANGVVQPEASSDVITPPPTLPRSGS